MITMGRVLGKTVRCASPTEVELQEDDVTCGSLRGSFSLTVGNCVKHVYRTPARSHLFHALESHYWKPSVANFVICWIDVGLTLRCLANYDGSCDVGGIF